MRNESYTRFPPTIELSKTEFPHHCFVCLYCEIYHDEGLVDL